MFCFEVDRDVAEELSRRKLGIHRAEVIQERVESRMMEAYPGIVAEVLRLARQPDALAAEEAAHAAYVRGVGNGGRLVPDDEHHGLPANTRIYDAAGLGARTADPVASEGPAETHPETRTDEQPSSWQGPLGEPGHSRTVDALVDPSRFPGYGAGNEPAQVHFRDEERIYVRGESGGELRRAAFRVRWQVEAAGGFPRVGMIVRLAVRRGPGVPDDWQRQLQERVTDAVERHLVPRAGLDFPGGARLRFAVQHVGEAGSPHLTVDVAGAGLGVGEQAWAYDAALLALAEAVARQLGLDQAGPFNPDGEQSVLGRGHLRLLSALAGSPEDLRDRLGWVRVNPGMGSDRAFLDGSVLPPGMAGYAVRNELAYFPGHPGVYARNPDGTLAASTQDVFLQVHRQRLDDRIGSFDQGGVTVAPDISDQQLAAFLDGENARLNWPELLTYLARPDGDARVAGGSGSRADRNSPLMEYLLRLPRPDLPTVRVSHDPYLRRDDPRIAAIEQALELVLGSGHTLAKELWILLPKYQHEVTVTIEGGRPVVRRAGSKTVATYFPPGDMVVGPVSVSPLHSPRDLQQGGHFSFAQRMQRYLVAQIVHELAHHLHYAHSPGMMLESGSMRFHPGVRELLDRVSPYAARNPMEAVAELLTKEILGFRLEQWEEDLLRALGAPRPGAPTPEHLNPQLSPEEVDWVAGKVAEDLGAPVDRELIVAAIGRLGPGERRLDLRLVAGAVEQVLQGGSPQTAQFSRAEEQLAGVLDDVSDGQDCAVRLEQAAKLWYPHPRVQRDDFVPRPHAPEDRLAAAVDGHWRPVGDLLGAVIDRVDRLGPGATAFLLSSPPDLAVRSGPANARHAYALRNEGGVLYWVETQAAPGYRFRRAGQWASHLPAPEVGTRVIVVRPDGRAVADPFEDGLPAPGRPDALLAPAGSTRYAGARPQLDAATEGRPDPAQTRDGSFDLVLQPTSLSRPDLPSETVTVRVKSGATPADLADHITRAYLSIPVPRGETLTVRAPAGVARRLLPDLTQALAQTADSHQLRVRFYLGDLGPMNICGSPCVA